MIAVGAAFFPPVGEAVAAVAGLASAILPLFGGGGGPSDVEIMSDMINEQTKVLTNKIDQQTEIQKKEFENIGNVCLLNT